MDDPQHASDPSEEGPNPLPAPGKVDRPGPERLLEAIERLLKSDRRHAERFMRFARDTRMSLEHVWCAFGPDDSIEATVLASPSAGRTAMLFASSPHDVEEARLIGEVIRRTCDTLDPEDVILAQALVEPSDKLEQEAFVHGGLHRLATLTYMERAMPRRNTIPPPEFPKGIRLARYRSEDRELLEKLLFATYEETLDCPGLAGLRSPSDVVEGHMHSGIFRPQWWIIAYREEQPVGVALFNGSAGASSIELVYLGIISSERGAGLGPALLQHGLRLVSGARERNIVLAVDEENEPALNMYEKACFHRTIRRTALVRSLDSRNRRDR